MVWGMLTWPISFVVFIVLIDLYGIRNGGSRWFFSSTGVLLTYAYRVYLRVNEDEGVTAKKDGLLAHYEFHKAISLFWINDMEARKMYSDAPANGFLSPTSSLSGMDDFIIASSIASPSALYKRSCAVNDSTLQEAGA